MANILIQRTKGHRLINQIVLLSQVDDRVINARAVLQQAQMIENFGAVVQEHSFSAPVVATMRAVPDFEQAATNFPEASAYNRIPENRASSRYEMGLESLGEVSTTITTGLTASVKGVTDALAIALSNIGTIAADLKSQIAADRSVLEQADIDDDEIARLQTFSLSETAFGESFAGLETYLTSFSAFDVDDVRANPELITEQAAGLEALVADLGQVLGLELSGTALIKGPKGEQFIPTEDSFEQKGLTKASLLYNLDRADGLCDMLQTIAEKKDEIVQSLDQAAQEIPSELHSSDVVYGANDHVALLCAYATLSSKALRETISLTSSLLTAVDGISDALDIPAAGETAALESVGSLTINTVAGAGTGARTELGLGTITTADAE